MSIESLAALREAVATAPAALVYFDAPACTVGSAVAPKLRALLAREFPQMRWLEVDVQGAPEAAAQTGVSTTPTVIIYFEGREHLRFSRSFSIDEVSEAVRRPYGLRFGAPDPRD